MRFSERNGFKSIRQELQIDSIDIDLRNLIWNSILKNFSIILHKFIEDLICDFFKEPLDKYKFNNFDEISGNTQKLGVLKQKFYSLQWYEVYDLIEFIANLDLFLNRESLYKSFHKEFKESINIYLEREFSAYRLVDNIIVTITNEIEIESIEKALNLKVEKFDSIQNHLQTGLKKLSDKKNPDYRNSIKESISSVEACCRILTGESTLGKALDKLEKNGIYVNNQLKQGFEKLYAYTNSKDSGIRHAILENGIEPDFEDAKFMLVSCSAVINYLISKTK